MTNLTKALQKHGAVGLVLAAALFYTIAYVPAVFYAGINSDEVMGLVFYRDIFQAGHSPAGWVIPGASNLFPDWSICFLLGFLLRDGLAGQAALLVLFFVAWLALLFICYRLMGGKRPAVFLSLSLLISVFFVREHLSHVGAMLNTIGCLDLTLFAWRSGSIYRRAALALLVFLGAGSDALFVIIFAGPSVAALALECLVHPSSRKAAAGLIVVIFLGAAAGYFSASWMFPVPSARAIYTELRWENVLACATGVWDDLSLRQHPYFVFLFTGNVLVLILGGVAAFAFRKRVRGSASSLVFLLAYTFALVALNWTALLLTNPWYMRYVCFSLVWPLLVAAGLSSEIFSRRSWIVRLLALGVALYTVWVARHPLPKSPEYLAAMKRIPELQALMAEEHMKAGLADYWYANLTTYLSGDKVCLRAMDHTHFYHWCSNLQWVEGDHRGSPVPKFRFLLMPNLDPDLLRVRFGPPDRIAKTSLGEEVWIYSEENAISNNPIFGELGNRHTFPEPDETLFTAATLPSQTGQWQGSIRIARAGRDRAGCLTFGPYLNMLPGRYRADYSYTYLKAPEPDKPVTFDCILHLKGEDYLDKVAIPYVDGTPRILSRQVVVPPHPDGAPLEMRLHYQGSGDFEVDSLKVTYLGP